METPAAGKIYLLNHSSGHIRAKFLRESKREGFKSFSQRAYTHYVFENLASGREIVIKSRVKILAELSVRGL